MSKTSRARGEVIRKVLFLIGNRHFLIRKCHFGIRRGSYVERGRPATNPSLLLSGASHDPPPPTSRRHRYRFRRPRRLLRYDGSEERCLPGDQRFEYLLALKTDETVWLPVAVLRGSRRLAQVRYRANHGTDLLGNPRRRGYEFLCPCRGLHGCQRRLSLE